jgi:hypothetical protein
MAVLSKTKESTKEDVKSEVDKLREEISNLPAGKVIKLSNGKEYVTGSVANNTLANRIF